MSAMDQMVLSMLQKMTGLSPDQMQHMANSTMQMLANYEQRTMAMESQLAEILALLKGDMPHAVISQIEDKSHAKSQ